MNIKSIFFGLLFLVVIYGCKESDLEVTSELFPNLKFGFTTQNFVSSTPISVFNVIRFIKYAKDQGFLWVELRDPDASLTLEQCKEIAEFAKENKIEINYTVQRGLLDEDFWEVFHKAVENTIVFEGPRFYRALALIGDGELGWTDDEFSRLIETANKAAAIAKEKGLGFCVENADTDLSGYGKPYYGLGEFFDKTDSIVKLQLDVANLFTGPVKVTPEEAIRFLERYSSRISYLHLKSAKDGKPLTVLDDNPLDFSTILRMMHEFGVQYVAIELFSEIDEQQVFKNMKISLDYLMHNGLITTK